MPQLVAVVMASAGLYAGLKWLAKTFERQARLKAEEDLLRRHAEGRRAPKDLGMLEYDPETQTYRPRGVRGA